MDNEGGDDTWQTAITYFREIEENKDGGLAYLQSDKFSQMQYIIQNDNNRQLLQAYPELGEFYNLFTQSILTRTKFPL